MNKHNQYSILFVCLGNICRSPTAEAVFRKLIEKQNLSEKFYLDSAGTSAHHVGEPPDIRSIKYGQQRGFDLSCIRSRQVCANDLETFDLILAMDNTNLNQLKQLCVETDKEKSLNKIKLILDYSAQKQLSEQGKNKDVPDPYYGGEQGFDKVIDLVEDASLGLLNQLKDRL